MYADKSRSACIGGWPDSTAIMGKLKRLRQMSAKEISHRLRAKVQSELERMRLHLGLNESSGGDLFSSRSGANGGGVNRRTGIHGQERIDFKRYLETGPAPRFYLPAVDERRERVRSLVSGAFPHWIERSEAEAGRLLEHKIEILGYGELELGRQIDWHRDPLTGQN